MVISMKNIIILSLIVVLALLAVTTYQTFNEVKVYPVFLAPLAILSSAMIAILIAIMSVEKTEIMNKQNRTIDFLTKDYPITKEIFEYLSSGQMKLILGNEKIINERISRNDFRIDLEELKSLVQSLSDEESSAIREVATYFERAAINLENGYFSKELVYSHFGENYGFHFWSSAWPFIVYEKHLSNLYSEYRGFQESRFSSLYAKFENHVLATSEVKNPYPRKAEKMTDEYPR